MKLSHILGAFGLIVAAGCGKTGGVSFSYVLLFNDAGQVAAAQTCGDVGVNSVRFAIGDDLNGNGILETAEEVASLEEGCNQADANGDGIIAEEDFGIASANRFIPIDTYDAISFSFLDAAGNEIPWQTFDVATDADIFTFIGDTVITKGDITNIALPGDGQQVNGELQVFFGF